MKKEFNIGDKVTLKGDLVVGKTYDGFTFLSSMEGLKGQTLTIAKVDDDNSCMVKESDFWFSIEMLKQAYKLIFKGNETILIKDGKEYVSKCADGDTYDKEKGLLLCLAKANGVSYDDLQEMIDGAEDKNLEKALEAAKVFGERLKVFLDAGFKALRDKDNANVKPEAENTVKEVKRPAKVGEYVKIVAPELTGGLYKKGDIRKVVGISELDSAKIEVKNLKSGHVVYEREYVVLENYKPYKITLSEFWKSKDELAIHCKTEDEAKELCKAFDKAGKKWSSGRCYSKYTNYENHGQDTAYTNDCGYSDLQFFKANGYKIYEFNEVDLNN